MGEHFAAKVDDIQPGQGIVVQIHERSVGLFRVGEEFYAIRNVCPHQGGPLGEGSLFPLLRAKVVETGKVKEFNDYEHMVLCCPWHGWEFDLKTGECIADRHQCARVYKTRVEGDQVIIID